jgi:serine acetyltransferase
VIRSVVLKVVPKSRIIIMIKAATIKSRHDKNNDPEGNASG